MYCYDLSKWHESCAGKSVITGNGYMYVYCPVCGVMANIESIAGKISAYEACRTGKIDRVITGGQSLNVDRGQVKGV